MTTATRSKRHAEFTALWAKAHAAGMAAGNGHDPNPMVVTEHTNPMDDSSPAKRSWFVSEGVCGFAWVVVRPGTTAFARWAAKHKGMSKHYYGGMEHWVHHFGQSYERKMAYARAFAGVLREAGVKAHAGGRLD